VFLLQRFARCSTLLLSASLVLVLTGCGSGAGSSGGTGGGSTTTPAATLNLTSLTFVGQSVSSSSPAQSLTLTNSGTASLVVTSVAASGDFSATNTCTAAAIPVNGTCAIQIMFVPTATGTRTGTLTVSSNAATATVPLTGMGIAAGAVSISPTSLSFPATYLTTTSVGRNITVTNNTAAAVYLQTPALTGDFHIATTNCGTSLAANSSCAVTINFAPTAAGNRTANFTIVDAGGTQTVAVTGTGQTIPTGSFSGSSFTGKVLAGTTTPVIGASVQIYAAGTSGNGSQANALLGTPVVTDATGAFTVAAGYSCPAATSQAYAIASGGKPGAAGTVNSAITFIAPLGLCSQITSSTSVVLNEATTAATVWAMSQFMASCST